MLPDLPFKRIFFRLSANRTVQKKPTVFRDFNIKNLILMESFKKARSVLYKKALKTNIYAVRFALITVFSFKKNEIFSRTLRAFYKNAQFFQTVRLAPTLFLESIC
jgi:hypothetical protein